MTKSRMIIYSLIVAVLIVGYVVKYSYNSRPEIQKIAEHFAQQQLDLNYTIPTAKNEEVSRPYRNPFFAFLMVENKKADVKLTKSQSVEEILQELKKIQIIGIMEQGDLLTAMLKIDEKNIKVQPQTIIQNKTLVKNIAYDGVVLEDIDSQITHHIFIYNKGDSNE